MLLGLIQVEFPCIGDIHSPDILTRSYSIEDLGKSIGADVLKCIHRLQVIPGKALDSTNALYSKLLLAADLIDFLHHPVGNRGNALALLRLECLVCVADGS